MSRLLRSLVAAAVLVLGVAALPGVAAANRNTVEATCDRLVFDMPASEAGTTVTVSLNGTTVHTVTAANQLDPIRFTLTTPDPTRANGWVIVVDSVWNTDQRIVRSSPPCPTATTTPPPTTAPSTTIPVTTTTVVVASTIPPTTIPATTVLATTVPTQSTTVITTPRPSTTVPSTPVTVPSTTPLLPATGGSPEPWALALGVAGLLAGAVCIAVARRNGGAS
jgi:LPXTG-motif cell wall-anchored protein